MGLEPYVVESPDVLPPGIVQVQMGSTYDGGGLGKGGLAALYVDGSKVAEGDTRRGISRVDQWVRVDDFDRFTNNAFNGSVSWVHIAIGDDSHGHYIDEEDRIRIALSLRWGRVEQLDGTHWFHLLATGALSGMMIADRPAVC